MRQKLESYLAKIWYGNKKPPVILNGLSKIFDRQRKKREKILKNNWLSVKRLPVPVIVVGNLSVGGTGKTPVVIFLIKELRSLGYSVGVMSRGYGGSLVKNEPLVLTEVSNAAEVGDEAFMIHQIASVPFAVGNKRVEVAQALLKQHPEINILISDDGLQHYHLQRDLEVVVVDGARGFGNMQLLPAGPLREPLSRLDTVDLVLINGHAVHESLENIDALAFTLQAKNLRKLNSKTGSREIQYFYGKTVHAFAGIGNPDRFFKLLESMGLDVVRHSLADHARMPSEFFIKHKDDILLMTEKDSVKYPEVFAENFWYLPVEVIMSPDTQTKVIEVLTDKLREKKQ